MALFVGFGGGGPLQKATKDVYKRSFIRIFYVWKSAAERSLRLSKWLATLKIAILVDHRDA